MTRPAPDPEIMAIGCPACSAGPGEHCRTKNGGSLRIKHPHQARKTAMWRARGDAYRAGKRLYQ